MAIHILGRIIFGAYFIISGYNHFANEKAMTGYAKMKGIPYPRLAILLTGAMLMVGGLGFLLNSFVEQSAVLLLLFLVPTTFVMHAFWNEKDPMARMGDRINFMKNMALIGVLLMII